MNRSTGSIKQVILACIIIWLILGATAIVSTGISQVLNRILSGIIVGCTATLIGYYVLSLPDNPWVPWKAHRNISILYDLYALFIYSLSVTISQGSLFGIKLGTVLGFNSSFIIMAAFILGVFMNIGELVDKMIADARRYLWLRLGITSSVYICIIGFAIAGFSFDYLFLLSLAIARISSSLAFGTNLVENGYEGFSPLCVRFMMVNLLVLPITAVLSK